MKKNLYKCILPALLIMQACSKDDTNPFPVTPAAKGLYVISEGGSTPNSAKLGFYNLGSSSFTGRLIQLYRRLFRTTESNGNCIGKHS